MMWVVGVLLLAALAQAQDYARRDAHSAQIIADVIASVDQQQSAACTTPRRADKPNILFFLADDLGFGDVSWNDPDVETPNLDQLAKDGIILDRNYVQPVCSPSRGAVNTGMFGHRIKMQHVVNEWSINYDYLQFIAVDTYHSVILADVPEGLETEYKILPEYLKPLGYKNHMLGKWHLGFCNEKYLPTSRGYDSFYGFYNSHIDHYTHVNEGYYDLSDNGVVDLANNMSYCPTLMEERAIDIINDHDSSDPLFMMFASPLPHTPLQLPPDMEQPDGWRDVYLGMVKVMDATMGKLVQALKDNGLYDNSIIVFTSDNGGMANFYFASNGPLRGAKGGIFEGGTRVPGFVHSPLQTTTGIRHEGSFHIVDWLPTLLNVAGGCAEGIDGVNQRKMVLNGDVSMRDEVVYNIDQYAPFTFGHGAIRIGNMKLILGYPGKYDGYTTDKSIGVTFTVDIMGLLPDSKRRKRASEDPYGGLGEYLELIDGYAQLYDVMDDPEERNNLVDQMPLTVAALKARIEHHLANAAELDLDNLLPSPAARNPAYNGIWTPGWC